MLTLNEAAEHVGMSPEDLMLTRQRGLPPGNLGVAHDGHVYFDPADLLPAPAERLEAMAAMVETVAANTLQCLECGFKAKSKGGLTQHRRRRHGAT